MGAHRPKKRSLAAALAAALVVVGVAIGVGTYPAVVRGLDALGGPAPGQGWPDAVEVRVLDVGQGNAVLVRTPEHHALLFDGGPADCDLGGQLRALGVRTLDLAVISHPHADHFAGLLAALDRLQVDALIDQVQIIAPTDSPTRAGAAGDGARSGVTSGTAKGEEAGEAADYLRLRRELAEDGCRYAFASTGHSVTVDGLVVRFFAPTRPLTMIDGSDPWSARGGQPPSGEELNAASLVAVVSVGSVDILIPGDAEAEVLQRYDLPSCNLIVVPHHGSRGAATERLLQGLGLQVAVVSVGANNYFGHPHADTVTILQQAVDTVLRTDQAGWVSCKVNGDAVIITTERTSSR